MTTTEPTSLTGTYLLDPAHTRLGFVARQAVVTKVRGAFETFDGQVYLDFADPERSSAEVTVDVASVNTHNTRRDRHLRKAFFDAANHPQITFRSTAVHRLEHDRFRLTGELTIKGHTRPVTIDFTHTGAAKDPYGDTRAGFEGQATLNRKDWGVTWNVALETGGVIVSDKITLELEVAAVMTDAYQ
jgi:polyisoprenoid-binding protein YceI